MKTIEKGHCEFEEIARMERDREARVEEVDEILPNVERSREASQPKQRNENQ